MWDRTTMSTNISYFNLTECVGKGKNDSKPDKYVKEATKQLRVE